MPGSSGGGGKIPQGVMIIGAIAGIVGLVLLLKGSGGGGGTTAAGTSINAALGSIEEENMNLLGTTQAGFMQTSQQMSALSNQQTTYYGNLWNEIGSGFSAQQGQISSGFAAMNTNDLEQMQKDFVDYATRTFGYQATLGGGAPALRLPQNANDYYDFLINPSLANPDYQAQLMNMRGFVFEGTGSSEPVIGGASNGTY